jgi:CxxC motif-containing protein
MMEKELICIICPSGCRIHVSYNDGNLQGISGFGCSKGREYAEEEVISPRRTLTTSVRVLGSNMPLLSVRTDKPIPKNQIFEAMREISKITVRAPVEVGDIVLKGLLNSDVNVIATRRVTAK